jgi:cytochrome c biogenesis protein CcmG, thiol:disulfide interchange protein DsbE
MRRIAPALALLVLLAGCGSGDSTPKSAARPAADMRALAGAPAPLAALHEQANVLLDGGTDAFDARLRELRGYPIVVNKWASWCGPCRGEFPYFQRQGVEHGKRIAFVGVDAADNDGDARDFLAEEPLTFPSYKDPDQAISAQINGPQATPVTTFYDAKGNLVYTHQGAYLSEEKLAQDIRRYAR